MSIDILLQGLQSRVLPLERFIQLFAGSLTEPKMCRRNEDRGFRYERPDVRHFCLLKGVRAVSALSASLELARSGYAQEIATLIRTLVECTTHIDFVLDENESEQHRSEVEKYIQAFFADSWRDPATEIKRAQVPQGMVHAAIGRTLDSFVEQHGDTEGRVPAAKLFSNIYRIYSNYVHAKYPEIMDLYGGRPGRFHLRGMSGTPKDGENLAIIESSIVTASNTIIYMIQRLNLRAVIESDSIVAEWYGERFKQTGIADQA
jgi:hypothetical protein